jgi:hypothetical protein
MTPQTNSTLNGAALRPEPELPKRAVNLARRTLSEMAKGNGRIMIEVIEAPDGSWLVFVDGGKREVLGK